MERALAHWHDSNPWGDTAVYVPPEEMAECLARGTPMARSLQPEEYLERWRRLGNAVDAYILPSPSGDHQVGIRWGSRHEAYLSPVVRDMPAIEDLLLKWAGRLESGPASPAP